MAEIKTEDLPRTDLYTLQLPSKLESITRVENLVDELAQKYPIAEDTYANMLTCLNEATINAIVHGNRESEHKKVYINLEVVDGRKFIFTVADEGEGFAYSDLADPTSPENIEALTGRGVFIMKHLADQCIFNSKGNEIELHFKI
ncbi:ATP-binding protein [Pedobacter sp. BS3]|uniref:ATP-binding protein n=1 Tax=Pedobacter sp. BS3 TaxID=2567937 RepID=UPI0011EFEBD9|nr:ATP-binding protein [Pedobacter sp. BS3]TZF82101.1 ATP-binding protein [Pedobacter sp. BS3]